MEKGINNFVLVSTLILGFLVQVIFSYADTVDTPSKTVVKFSKAYFKLDPGMAKYLCTELASEDEADVVGTFLYNASKEAKDRGFKVNYLKSYIYEITTETLTQSEDSARVRIHCKRRTSINPIYAIVAKIFFIGNTYSVDEVIDMIKENGKWKVCGKPFSLT